MKISSKIGHEKRNRGRKKLSRPLPLDNQITISLSRYMRESVPTAEMKTLMVRIVGKCPSMV